MHSEKTIEGSIYYRVDAYLPIIAPALIAPGRYLVFAGRSDFLKVRFVLGLGQSKFNRRHHLHFGLRQATK